MSFRKRVILFTAIAITLLGAHFAVYADNEFKFTPNEAGGYIFFTYSYCVYKGTNERIPNSFYVYSTGSNGARILDGCYTYKPPFYVINWNNGERTSIVASSTSPIN